MKPDILGVCPIFAPSMERLAREFTYHKLWEAPDQKAFLAQLAPKIRGAVTSGAVGMKADLIDALPKLEVISSFGVGVDGVDQAACKRRGVRLSNTPDVLTGEVADFGMTLLLAAARQVPQADAYLRRGDYKRDGKDMYPLTRRARGRKVGVVGMGRIGMAFAKLCEAFEMPVSWHGPRPKADVPYPYVADLKKLAADVDFLVLTCKGGPETAGLVSAEVLAALGPKGTLVNIARGSVVDEKALVAALKSGALGSAAIDVYVDEPNVPAELMALDNVVLQPHVASGTVETRGAMGDLTVDNVASWFRDGKLLTPVL